MMGRFTHDLNSDEGNYRTRVKQLDSLQFQFHLQNICAIFRIVIFFGGNMKNSLTVESSALDVENAEAQSSSKTRDEQASQPEFQSESNQLANHAQEEIPSELLELIGKEIERRFQSAKDKRWAQLEKQYGELHELSLRKDSSLGEETSTQGERPIEDQMLERAQKLLGRLGLRNSPETAALLRDQNAFDGPGGYLDLVEKVLAIILPEEGEGENTTPTPAGVIAPSGGTNVSTDLAALYQHRKRKIRPGDINALTALKREFREKGLNIF